MNFYESVFRSKLSSLIIELLWRVEDFSSFFILSFVLYSVCRLKKEKIKSGQKTKFDTHFMRISSGNLELIRRNPGHSNRINTYTWRSGYIPFYLRDEVFLEYMGERWCNPYMWSSTHLCTSPLAGAKVDIYQWLRWREDGLWEINQCFY